MSLVGKKAPIFSAPAVIDGSRIVNEFSLEKYLGKNEIVLFFYPKDFTYVCPTELLSFQKNLAEFHNRGVKVIGCSTDTEETHLAWLNTPISEGGIQGITYPLIADSSKTISSNYDVLAGNWVYHEDDTLDFEGLPIAYRGTFFIDIEGVIRYQSINDLPLGRNIEEILRVVDMWHHISKYGEVCPADWNFGKKAMSATQEGVKEYMQNYSKEMQEVLSSGCCGGVCGTTENQGGNCSSGNCCR